MLRSYVRFYFSPDGESVGSGTGGSQSGDGGGPASTPGEPRMVPESDLMALKSAKDVTQKELETAQLDLAEKVGALDLRFGELTAAKAKHQELEAQLATLQTSASEVDKLKATLAASDKSRDALSNQLVDSKRAALVLSHGYKPEDVQEFGLSELTVLEKALAKLPTNQIQASASRGGGSTGSQDGLASVSSLDRMKRGFNQ